MGRKNKRKQEGEGNHERWLLTYCDMITLLMAFFIMMYSMSVLNLKKFSQVAISIRSGFNGVAKGQGKSILGSSGQFGVKPSPIDMQSAGVAPAVLKKAQDLVIASKLSSLVKFRQDERGLIISLVTDKVLFVKGQAELSSGAGGILHIVADILKSLPNLIRVEGHTCNLPIHTEKFPTNWELSSARASRVVRYLIEKEGIPSDRLSAAGYADKRPLPGYPNTNEANRIMNRRVDIVILKSTSL